MSTGAPPSRKTHVTRIFGTNRNGDVLTEIFADVERMDLIKSAMQIPPDRQWQGIQRKLLWCDDPKKEGYAPDGTPSRLTEIMKVCDPDSADVNDPDEWIPLRVIIGMKSKGGGGEGMGEGFMDRFLNAVIDEELHSARVVETRRIVHCDTNIDADAQAAVDADPTLREFVVAGENYTRDESTKDVEQYIEQQIVTYLKHKGNSLAVQAMGRQTRVLNDYLIAASEEAKGEITGNGGINPPYRLDPFQNIVNVNLGGSTEFLWTSRASDIISDGWMQAANVPLNDSFFFTYSGFLQVKRSSEDGQQFSIFNSSSNPDINAIDSFGLSISLMVDLQPYAEVKKAAFLISFGGRPIDLNAFVVDASGGGGTHIVAPQLPVTEIKWIPANAYVSASFEISEILDPFHLFVTIDSSPPTAFALIPADIHPAPPRSIISVPQVRIRLNNRSIEAINNFNAPKPGSPIGTVNDMECFPTPTSIPAGGPVVGHPGSPGYGGASSQTGLNFDSGTGESDTAFFQCPNIGSIKLPWQGMTVGVPFAYLPATAAVAAKDPFDDSISMQAVQVWTNQVIAPSTIPQYFMDDKGNSRPVGVAQDAFGKSAFVLDGGPKTFAANKRGSAPELHPFGAIKLHKKLRRP